MEKTKIVVIGNGMVGQRFLEQLVTRGADKATDFDITTFCEEPRPAYDRVQLTSFFSGKTAADLSLVTKSFFEKAQMTLRLNAPRATAKCRTTSWCSPPAPIPSCRRFPARTAATASSTARSRIWR
jgi:nitrite reductase (NADH) large subunit